MLSASFDDRSENNFQSQGTGKLDDETNVPIISNYIQKFYQNFYYLSQSVVKEKPILENWQSLQKLSLGASETLQSPSNHQILIS